MIDYYPITDREPANRADMHICTLCPKDLRYFNKCRKYAVYSDISRFYVLRFIFLLPVVLKNSTLLLTLLLTNMR